ncbi:cytochrome c biogenesis protein CcdA [Hydrotalea sp.]|uniref:protein-disulfide reductase DsbD family protein n=1 Tax=Hydrotalea sp. TaxID=2881279 RepID=UPI00258C06A7|nr:cytochrome c biogenesis protein CcdA [Hydrotalea sp.]
MKYLFSFLLLLFSFAILLQAQPQHPVKFSYQAERLTDTSGVLKIQLKSSDSTAFFAAEQSAADNPFTAQLHADSSTIVELHRVKATGRAITEKDNGGNTLTLYPDSVTFEYPLHLTKDSTTIKGTFVWLGKKGENYPSNEEKFLVQLPSVLNTANSTGNTAVAGQSLWSVFLLTFGAGLLAIITPCVFPLIPVTVSFFLKRSKTRTEGIRNAVWYSISIIAIYTIPTLLLTLIFGDTVLYTISTSAITNILFFAIFIVFAISFFGAFELNLPSSWANKADQKAGKGGLSGIFFMALTLVIVSFSCTGPIVGTLLGQTSAKGVSIAPVIGMLGFGVGLALPFSLFAFFPSMLSALPKSGGWLNSVKVTFGFIELALALKFLSNVDLIYHWHLLNRDVFLVLWIVVFGLMGMYLLGKLKFSHDSDLPYLTVPRLFFAIITFSFALYLIPGLWGAPLQPLSGFIPPATTQDFNLENLNYKIDDLKNGHFFSATNNGVQPLPPKKYTDRLEVPFGLTAYFDLEEGMAAAKIVKKPIMLDFTGHSCPNCRKMEEQVWKNPDVLRRIKNNFVLVSLYVDESTELPAAEQITLPNGDKLTTVGEKNLNYEVTKFGLNAQPLYMFLDLNGQPLSEVKYGYNPDVSKFIQHLDAVKQKFNAEQK